jgi:hypothetical protein
MKNRLLALSVLMTAFATSAHAALPAALDTELTNIQTDALALADKVWPVVIVVTGAAVLLKLFKRFVNKI